MPPSVFELYPELYHYTGVAGLKGIIESQTLWATHYAYLNDSQEIVHFAERLPSILRPAVEAGIDELIRQAPVNQSIIDQAGGKEKNAVEIAHGIVTGMYNAFKSYAEPHIISFCTPDKSNKNWKNIADHGLLSQWRGYGNNGGYAIVFDTAKLGQLIQEEYEKWMNPLWIGDVVYSGDSDDKFRAELGSEAEIISTSIKDFLFSAGNPATLENTYDALCLCACRYKHWGFEEEHEVRLIAIPLPHSARVLAKAEGLPLKLEKSRKHFMRGGTAVPYLKLFEDITSPHTKCLPITRVIVGPHPEKEKRKRAIEILLKEYGVDAEVSVSEIPYLGT